VYYDILLKLILKIVSLFISCALILIEMCCEILQKVKLTSKIISSVTYIFINSINYISNNNIVVMYPGNFSGSYFGGNSGGGEGSSSSGAGNSGGLPPGGNPGGGHFGGGPSNVSTFNLHPMNYMRNRLTAALSPDRRDIIRTS
jgi:uncharacterized membrane protein YgcG